MSQQPLTSSPEDLCIFSLPLLSSATLSSSLSSAGVSHAPTISTSGGRTLTASSPTQQHHLTTNATHYHSLPYQWLAGSNCDAPCHLPPPHLVFHPLHLWRHPVADHQYASCVHVLLKICVLVVMSGLTCRKPGGSEGYTSCGTEHHTSHKPGYALS